MSDDGDSKQIKISKNVHSKGARLGMQRQEDMLNGDSDRPALDVHLCLLTRHKHCCDETGDVYDDTVETECWTAGDDSKNALNIKLKMKSELLRRHPQ